MERLRVEGRWFVDARGRRRLLRGVNLGANAKTPVSPPGATHLRQDPATHRTVSFRGRPFPVADADAWFARLRGWGVDVVRYLVTWEAIEHAGPGIHDEAYLDDTAAILARAAEHGIHVVVDPHQDAWSRWSGGDGAPGWTLEAAGFDLGALGASGAAILDWEPAPGADGPMVWPNNWGRLASATMFSLFFASSRVAPDVRIEGEPADAWLQGRFLAAVRALAERLAGLPNVLGYEALNEPSAGYLGNPDLARALPVYARAPRITGLESLALGSGVSVRAPVVDTADGGERVTGEVVLNPDGVRAWRADSDCPWRAAGVWDLGRDGRPRLLRPDHFAGVSFWDDGMRPFLRRFAAAIREVHPDALLFVEGEPGGEATTRWDVAAGDPDGIVHAPHWYDLATLQTRRWRPDVAYVWGRSGETVTGRDAVRASFREQIGRLDALSASAFGGVPTLVGEIGVPFDLDGGGPDAEAAATEALHAYADALDASLASATWWNVTPDNAAPHADGWNGEDLSLVTRTGVAPGAPARPRALAGWSRPRLTAVAGVPVAMTYDPVARVLTATVDADATADTVATEAFLPVTAWPEPPAITVSAGVATLDAATRVLAWRYPATGRHTLEVRPAP